MDELERAREWHRRGALTSAITAYERALGPDSVDLAALHDYAIALLQARRVPDAADVLIRALRLEPGNFDLLLALAQARQLQGYIEDALACAEAATRGLPASPLGWFLRGRLETVSGDYGEALDSLRRAVSLAPNLDEAWHYLGECLQRQGRWSEAERAYRHAMRSQPGEILNIGICREQAGHWDEALDAYRRMCDLYPGRGDSLTRLAQLAAMLCDFDTEMDATNRLNVVLAHADKPGSRASPGDCPEPFALSYLRLPDSLRRAEMQRYARRVLERAPPPLEKAPASREPRIRIGYVGADFGRHAVSTLLRGLFRSHDRTRFEVFGYSLKRHDDSIGTAIRAEFDVCREVEGASFANIAGRIREDGVDVLIDLGGYTRGARPEVLAMRPAPLQLGWLGFVHGQEAPWLDGVILDRFLQPPEADWPYTDKVMRVAGFSLPCGPLPQGNPDRVRFGLPRQVPLFASFSNSYKLDSELVEAWVEILRRVPTAHIAVYLPPQARTRFQQHWLRHGGDPDRLHLLDHLPMQEQADRAASCDLFLDAFRYQAGATALACVAAGLPILSRNGVSPLARLSAALNGFLGLDELICADTAGYIEQAVALALDAERRNVLRMKMRLAAIEKRLFDPRRAAEAIESLVCDLIEARTPRPGGQTLVR